MNTLIDRRRVLISTSAFGLFASPGAAHTASLIADTVPFPIPSDTNWLNFANDLAATRYASLSKINAAN
jgi:hypothetical protein